MTAGSPRGPTAAGLRATARPADARYTAAARVLFLSTETHPP